MPVPHSHGNWLGRSTSLQFWQNLKTDIICVYSIFSTMNLIMVYVHAYHNPRAQGLVGHRQPLPPDTNEDQPVEGAPDVVAIQTITAHQVTVTVVTKDTVWGCVSLSEFVRVLPKVSMGWLNAVKGFEFVPIFWMNTEKLTRAGFEPATSGLTCRCSTNWAN